MKVIVAGGTGFIGRALVQALIARGDEVIVLGRLGIVDPSLLNIGAEFASWTAIERNPQTLEGANAVVNLVGESINQRWTRKARQRIRNSRTEAAEKITMIVQSLHHKPEVVVNSSGVAVYGNSLNEVFTEQSPMSSGDFLTDTAVMWERSAFDIPVDRIVVLRTSVVLGNGGGALGPMTLPYKLFGGGKVGSGQQWLSWIHLEDMVRCILFCLDHKEIRGPVNACAPNPLRNDDFGRAIGRALNRPHWLPVPSILMKLIFGRMSTLLVDGQNVVPEKLLHHGFEFHYETADEALNQLLR